MTTALNCVTQRDGDRAVIRIEGELDMSSRDVLIRCVHEVLEAGAVRVELDLTGVPFCDSSGLSALIAAQRIANADDRILVVGEVSAAMRNLLSITGIYDKLTVTPPRD